MTRDKFDTVAQHCADLGVDIVWADLGPRRRGECQCRSNTIVLNHRLTMAQAASTGAHEIGHWVFGDQMSTPANERRAWEYGASLLVPPWEYERAEAMVGPHVSGLAIELGVTSGLVEAWRRWWFKRGRLLPEYAGMTTRRDA